MEKFLEKISRYHLLTNLIPGVLFLYLVNLLGIFRLDMMDVLMDLFVGYFAGMVLSRIGSVVIEPWYQKWKIVKYAPYPEFLKAEQSDPKISELLSDNNMYRTFIAMFMVLLLLYTGHIIPQVDELMHTQWAILILLVLLLALFIFAFRKQTSYIRKRVKKANNLPIE